MSALTKTITSVATATVIATGVYVVYNDGDSELNDQAVDDVVAQTVEVPTVQVPTVEIPKVGVPEVEETKVEIPGVTKIVTITDVQLKELNLPQVSSASVNGTSVTLENLVIIPDTNGNYEVKIATASTTVIITPNPNGTYSVEIPENLKVFIDSVSTKNVNIKTVSTEERVVTVGTATTATASTETVKTETVQKYDDRMPQVIAIAKLQQLLFRDKRNISYTKDFGIDSKTWPQWRQIYQNDEKYVMTSIPMNYSVRMVAEAQVPSNSTEATILDYNLELYEKLGYDSVLFTFSGGEKNFEMGDVIDLIKSKGMKVFFSYSGPENLSYPIFKDTDMLSESLQYLAKKCDGYILGWRRTALHLFIPDQQFTSFIIKNVRTANPNIVIIGESYYGANAESDDKSVVSYNVPENCSGTLISGIGFSSVNINGALNGLFTDVKSMKRIGVVVGDRPYFLTNAANNLGFQKNLEIKKKIENKFIKYGCIGTITLHGDTGVIRSSDGINTTSDAMQKFKHN